jgi:prepilin signal peptidase PulO-like enzyme (type II secretory pathway)
VSHALTLRSLLIGIGWGVFGAATGFGIRRFSVYLALTEKLEPGFKRWQVWGPPILAAILFGLFGQRYGNDIPVLLIRTLWVAVLVQVIFFDAEHRLILDKVMFPSMVLALGLSIVTPDLGFLNALFTGLAAGGGFLVLALLGALIYGGDALGFGDVKLVAFMGLILGFNLRTVPIVSALFFGVLLAGVISLLLVVTRIRSMKDAIPYGPFLAAGALIVLWRLAPL